MAGKHGTRDGQPPATTAIAKSKIEALFYVAPGFKNKTRYTPYVSLGSQISHIAINKGNIKIQCLNT